MKTPREILLQRHRHVEPKLDAIRRQVVARLADSASAEAAACDPEIGSARPAVFRQIWQHLIWPSRWAWMGMAAIWIVVLGMHLEMKTAFPAGQRARAAVARQAAETLREQRQLLAELLPPGSPAPLPVPAPRPTARPRSEGPILFKAC